ncbi:hypothetical protein EBU94_09070, partial [bacterium]|nr:hypothetical protein [bacterium]
FSAAVNKLEGLKINIKIDPTNVNVNFNTGGSFIGSLTEGAKAEIGSIVSAAIKGSRVGQDGNIIPGNSSPLGTSV